MAKGFMHHKFRVMANGRKWVVQILPYLYCLNWNDNPHDGLLSMRWQEWSDICSFDSEEEAMDYFFEIESTDKKLRELIEPERLSSICRYSKGWRRVDNRCPCSCPFS
jgi:hypothetical protein